LAAETILPSIQDQLNMKPRVFVARPIQQMVIDQLALRCDVKVHPDDAPMTLSAMKDALADMDG
jgi:hypothetical protein